MRIWPTIIALTCLAFITSSCNYLPEWMGKDEAEERLPGERIALKRGSALFEAEISANEHTIKLPPEQRNDAWNQPMGVASGVSDHLSLPAIENTFSARIGDGDTFETVILPSPVAENGKIYALDGNGTISAHEADTLELLWQSDALENEDGDDPLYGGGLAVAGKVLYGANDEGKVVALSTESGQSFWSQALKLPLRAAPRLIGKTLLIMSADNQLLALNRRNGEPRWVHQGLNDEAAQLQDAVPAAGGDMVLATYSSGEVTALSLKDGAVIWNDMLAGSAQTALQEERFGVISTLMTPRVSFAGSSKSFTAYMTANGRRIWERRIPLSARPWLTGTTLYMLTSDAQLLAVNGSNGRILWVQNLPSKNGDETITWQHPIVASGKVWMVGNHGILQSFDALSGETGDALEIADNIAAAPVIVDDSLYLLGRDATLYALR